MARQGEIAGAIGAPSCSGNNVLNFERDILHATVRALSIPLFEQIFPKLISTEAPLLILDARDLWIFQELCVEAH
jgi:hypothetical protein